MRQQIRNGVAFIRQSTGGWRPVLLSAGVSLLLIAAALIWSKFTLIAETRNGHLATSELTRAVETHLQSRLIENANALERMARHFGRGYNPGDYASWRSDAQELVDDSPELQAVEYIGPDLTIQWIEPLKGNEEALGLDLKLGERRKRAVEEAVAGYTTISQAIDFVQGGTGFLIYAPIMEDGEFKGMIAGVCNVDRLMATIPRQYLNGYVVTLAEGSKSLYTSGSQKGQSEVIHSSGTIRGFGKELRLTLTPKQGTVNSWHSHTTSAVFVFNVAAALAVFLGLNQFLRSREVVKEGAATAKFLTTLSDTSVAITYAFDYRNGKIKYVNPFTEKLLGIRKGESGFLDLVVEEDLLVQAECTTALESCRCDYIEFEARWRAVNGDVLWLLHRIGVMERDHLGNPTTVIGSAFDLSEQRARERSVAQMKETLDNIIDTAAIGMALVSPDGQWLRVNQALSKFLGYSENELLSIDFQEITHPGDLASDLGLVKKLLDGKISHYSMEKRYVRKDGVVVWALLNVSLSRDGEGKPVCFISQIHDIDEAKKRQEASLNLAQSLKVKADKYAELAKTDDLTRLPNRRAFNEHFEVVIEECKARGMPLSLIVMDIDHFKKVNDTLGHEGGDTALQYVAGILADTQRPTDFAARLGGEEFAIICGYCPLEQTASYANRLRKLIGTREVMGMRLTASFGVSTLRNAGDSTDSLLREADEALYEAKRAGRDRVCSSTPDESDRQVG